MVAKPLPSLLPSSRASCLQNSRDNKNVLTSALLPSAAELHDPVQLRDKTHVGFCDCCVKLSCCIIVGASISWFLQYPKPTSDYFLPLQASPPKENHFENRSHKMEHLTHTKSHADTPWIEQVSQLESVDIPEFFDTRFQWQGCGTFVIDQKQCGDCWAASAANTLGDRVCIHLLENGKPITLPNSGAQGAGNVARMFDQAGKCVGPGTMSAPHQHGCQRQAYFLNPQSLVSCGNVNITTAPTYHPYPEGSGYMLGTTLYPSSAGCNGGEAQDAWRFFYHEGLTVMDSTESGGCTAYSSGTCSGADPENNGCRPCEFSECADTGLKPERFTVDSFGWIAEEGLPERGRWQDDESFSKNGTDKYRPMSQRAAVERQVKKMQIEMMTNGPLQTCIDDYANFAPFYNRYPNGIYNSTEGSPRTGGHCIELVGWGTDHATGMKYWTWKNSWGTNFASGGFARFIRGVDLLGIESDVWTGCPSGSNCKLTAGVIHNESWVPMHAGLRHPSRTMSRSWPGGKEFSLGREAFSHESIAPLVAAAARQALGLINLDDSSAVAKVSRVSARSVRGLKVRVEVEVDGRSKHATAHRHMDGQVTTN